MRLRPQADLRALVVIANPSGIDEFEGLAPVDVAAHSERGVKRRSRGMATKSP